MSTSAASNEWTSPWACQQREYAVVCFQTWRGLARRDIHRACSTTQRTSRRWRRCTPTRQHASPHRSFPSSSWVGDCKRCAASWSSLKPSTFGDGSTRVPELPLVHLLSTSQLHPCSTKYACLLKERLLSSPRMFSLQMPSSPKVCYRTSTSHKSSWRMASWRRAFSQMVSSRPKLHQVSFRLVFWQLQACYHLASS